MRTINQLYIDGAFVEPHGTERLELVNPTTEDILGHVVLADREDALRAVAAAKRALPSFSQTSKAERVDMLKRLHAAVLSRKDALRDATVEEYGGPLSRSSWVSQYAAQSFLDAATVLETYEFEQRAGRSTVVMEPVGVALLITPWNSNAGSICSKLAMAIAAGCTTVIKPSELSAIQTQILAEALHEAGLPPGVINILNGRGDVIGAELSTHRDIARISFTGSGGTGKAIARLAMDTMKRVTLGLGGKSPSLILDDADLATALPAALTAAFQNSGQACIAGSRLLVPRAQLAQVTARIKTLVEQLKVGDPADPETVVGPMANRSHFERVQSYIRRGIEEGATVLVGGPGRPDDLSRGFFVRPTVFVDVRNDMTIAQEEIFGPVLSIVAYDSEDEAVSIANDSMFGLHAYVFSSNPARAQAVARRLQAGRVAINAMQHDPLAPFGGYKQSGIGREFGVQGLESFLEAKTIMAPVHGVSSAASPSSGE
ncbi:MAG TPA: aldehyde dehydrogenase family protein [Burkholderiaceae bacterium]|jgi:aldehyde dehydrogenase (NAD+)